MKLRRKKAGIVWWLALGKYFIPPGAQLQETNTGRTLVLDGDIAHYLLHVMRLTPGTEIIFCDGQRMDYPAVMTGADIKKRLCTFMLSDPVSCNTEPFTHVTLYQGLPKGDKLDSIIQKCVELGVSRIIPVSTARAVARPKDTDKKIARYQRIAEAAASQSLRGVVPQVCAAAAFTQAVSASTICVPAPLCLVAYENEHQRTITSLGTTRPPGPVHLWVGPEGGFTDEEIATLTCHGALPISLGRRILRTETAGMAMLAMLACLWGEL